MNDSNQNQTNNNKDLLGDIILEIIATIFVVAIVVACFWIIS
jgi:flagellar basal body-associated protein FliL